MATADLAAMAHRIETEPSSAAQLAPDILAALKTAGVGVAADMTPDQLSGSTDAVLLLVDHAFPGWAVKLDGTASVEHGAWTCSLRRSLARDNDAFLGVGKSNTLPGAVLAAMLRAMAMRPAAD